MRHTELDMWADWMRAGGYTEKTIRTRVSQVETLARYAHLRDPAGVATADLIGWLGGCATAWTRHTYWASARAWCKWLVEMGVREDDPSHKLPRPKAPQGMPRPVSWAVIEKLLANPPSVRTYAYVALAAYGGLRAAEIAQVRGEDFDVGRGWFYVDGKGGQRAAVPLHPVLARLCQGMPAHGCWFGGADHGHVRAKSVSNTVNAALRRVGAEGTCHGLRHAYATQLLASCHNVRLVQLAMRHRSLASTQVYAGVSDEDLAAAVHSLPWVA